MGVYIGVLFVVLGAMWALGALGLLESI